MLNFPAVPRSVHGLSNSPHKAMASTACVDGAVHYRRVLGVLSYSKLSEDLDCIAALF